MTAMLDNGCDSKHESANALVRSRGGCAVGAVIWWRDLLPRLLASYRALRLRPLLLRSFYPSVLAVRLGQATGIDGLFLEILADQFLLEVGAVMPADLSLAELAAARAELLPRALVRRGVRLLIEQHVIARLHVLLAQENYYVEAWIRAHHRNPWFTLVCSAVARVARRRRWERDPVAALRTDPDAFSAFVWKRFWALPELEGVLDSAVPATQPRSWKETTDSDPVTTAVKVAMNLDADHVGWAQPEKLLRDLHAEIRAASTLAPDHALVHHVLRRVQLAVKRLPDFDEAYERGTAQDPLPEWVNSALEAVDSLNLRHHGADSAPKLVRRISCRLWVTGAYQLPSPAQPPLVEVKAETLPMPSAVVKVTPEPSEQEVETGF